jgi:putative heme-binding domain-containing protein
MHASSFRTLGALLALSPLLLLAQDHAAPGPSAQKGAPNPNQALIPGQDPAPAAAKKGGGRGRGLSAADLAMDLEKIIANPTELAKGQKIFEQQCVTCHGPKGEGERGPTLAQPNLARATDNQTLMQIVARGIPNTEMVGGRLKAGEAPYLAAYVRSLGRRPIEKVPGDPQKGAELFKTKGACLTCHTLDGQGTSAIGPDLTDVGARRSPAFLRRSLVDPAADVPQTFQPNRQDISMPTNFSFIKVKTKDGKELGGVRVNESTLSVQFRDMTGAVWSFYKSELASFEEGKGSPMPVYSGLFSPSEMDDMVAYLVSLRGKKVN